LPESKSLLIIGRILAGFVTEAVIRTISASKPALHIKEGRQNVEWSTIVLILIFIGVTTSTLFVFVSAARLYVSDTGEVDAGSPESQSERRSMNREGDRRKRTERVEFPLRVGNVIIEHERRRTPDRRRLTLH
jgi:hypothetical protein